MTQSRHLFLPKVKLYSFCYSFTCRVKILGNYLKTENKEKHKAENISIHCLPWPDSFWKQKIQWRPLERVKNIRSIMLTTTVGVILFLFFPFHRKAHLLFLPLFQTVCGLMLESPLLIAKIVPTTQKGWTWPMVSSTLPVSTVLFIAGV